MSSYSIRSGMALGRLLYRDLPGGRRLPQWVYSETSSSWCSSFLLWHNERQDGGEHSGSSAVVRVSDDSDFVVGCCRNDELERSV